MFCYSKASLAEPVTPATEPRVPISYPVKQSKIHQTLLRHILHCDFLSKKQNPEKFSSFTIHKFNNYLFKINRLPGMKICADTIPQIHYFSAAKVLRPAFDSIDTEKMVEPVTVNHPVQQMGLQIKNPIIQRLIPLFIHLSCGTSVWTRNGDSNLQQNFNPKKPSTIL